MTDTDCLRKAHSCALDPRQAAQEFHAMVAKDRIGELLQQNNTVGFHTYGEQFRGVHVNQTLVGIAFGTNGGEASLA
jgi:hypothetical protein